MSNLQQDLKISGHPSKFWVLSNYGSIEINGSWTEYNYLMASMMTLFLSVVL